MTTQGVSVLMCVRNGGKVLGEAIGSVLGQSYRDFEFVIVENASTDDTPDILACYARRDPRIKIYRTDIPRLGFNLNYGLARINSALVARMDADDIALPERLAKQVAYFESHPETDVLGTAFETFGEECESEQFVLPLLDAEIRRRLPFRFSICHPSVMFKRSSVLAAGGYEDFLFAQDLNLWLRMARKKDVVFANLPEVLLRYRVHADQSKGSLSAYLSAARVLWREGVNNRPLTHFSAAAFSIIKMIFRTRR